VVYLSGLWPATEQPLLLILAIGGVFILVAHDVLPATRLGPVRLVVEGAVAITLATLVVALTGGAASPFFYAYLLVVAGAALIVRPISAVALGSAAAGSYLVAVVVAAGGERLGDGETAIVLVNLTALVLLAYVALVVAREQRRTRDAALRLSTIDALTGLANRAYVLAAVEREIDRATRYRHGFCILMADLDGLKEVNDTLGHQAGDRALASVAAVIRASVRRIDTAARLGGDEFVVLLPETDREGARVVAEKVRQGVAAVDIVERDRRVALGVSIGIGEWVPGRTLDEVMVEADDAMYHEKRRFRAGPAGRGRELAAVGPGWPVEVDEGAVAWPPEVPRGRP
jgi:diguanylate cyclase (GGDEF)-like protein